MKRILENSIRILETIFYTAKYNWFYILLSVLAPLVIYKMGAGREIVSLLMDGSSPYWAWNTLFLILSLALMSTTTWLIPSLSVYPITCYSRLVSGTLYKRKIEFFQYLINLYNGSSNNPLNPGRAQVPAKYLAMLPWIMICATFIQFSIKNDEIAASVTFFLALTTMLFSVLVYVDGILIKKKRVSHGALAIFIVALVYLAYIGIRCNMQLGDVYQFNRALIVFLVYTISMVATFVLLTRGHLLYKNIVHKKRIQVERLFRINNRVHASLFAVTLGALIVLTYLALSVKLPAVSSLTVLLLCLNFYMLLVDSLFTSQLVMVQRFSEPAGSSTNVKAAGYKVLIGVLFLGFIWLIFFNNTSNYKHTLPHSYISSISNETLESYFEKWRRNRLTFMPDTSKPMNVYLISGQGGGSRAAVYILAVLRKIEAEKDRELYNQTFSISTISGSSAGIGQYIGQHENKELSSYLKDKGTERLFQQLKQSYAYNFFNSNLLGLLFYDRIPRGIKNVFYTPESDTYGSFNRNYVQEKEELRQLENFTNSFLPGSSFNYSFLQRDIQHLYNKKETPYATPLVFFNTTVLNQGKKGIFSPLADDSLFVNNIDLSKDGKPVTFHFAELSSQSFPLLNNFSRLNGDYFGDGGIYENSGTSTTLQIYKLLRRYCTKNNYKVRFILLNVLNASEEKPDQEDEELRDGKSILSLLVSAVSSIPFNGHETDAKLSVGQEVRMINRYAPDNAVKDTTFSIEPKESFALTRVFSQSTLNNFISHQRLEEDLKGYENFRKSLDSIDKPEVKSTARTPEIYRLYTQYRRSSDKEAVKDLLSSIEDMVVSIPPIDLVENTRYENEIRYFYKRDYAKAVKLKRELYRLSGVNFRLSSMTGKSFSVRVPEGQLELWIRSLNKP